MRYYNPGAPAWPTAAPREGFEAVPRPKQVRVPAWFAGDRIEHREFPEGAAIVSLQGVGFYIIPQGAWWDCTAVGPTTIKQLAPCLLTEEEAAATGVVFESAPQAAAKRKAKE